MTIKIKGFRGFTKRIRGGIVEWTRIPWKH